jgi:FtsP/CotA-like multicopper oxidase with cupredoxin domain
MRLSLCTALAAPIVASSFHSPIKSPVERITINDNRSAAGVARGGALTVRLEVREGVWHPDGESDPGLTVRAFAEAGKQPSAPGPVIRVVEGTEIHAFIHNTLSSATLYLHGLSPRGAPRDANATSDFVQILPGATREVRFRAGAPGTYYYWATTDSTQKLDRAGIDSQLNGAFVIDAPSVTAARDRIFVISLWQQVPTQGFIGSSDVVRFAINGKSWPHTERLSYAAGDTVRFRLINATVAPHPMHLHGFYYKVDSRGDGSTDSVYDRHASPRMVVTERMAAGRTFTMTWLPTRPGNWLFHCHDNFHVLRNRPLDGSALPPDQMAHVMNHATEMMGGLVMGIEVRGPDGSIAVAKSPPGRRLRLIARIDSGGTDAEPAYGYAIEDPANASAFERPLLPGPTIVLKRGEPVSITVVNALREATSVHWHGIELESYYDGVSDFAGSGRHIAPAIAPGDSFVARFTPPRSGTFMYHPHADEVRQQQAGMSGALLVVDDPRRFDPSHDIVLLIATPRRSDDDAVGVLVNGSLAPPPLDLRAGEIYRLRLVNIHTNRPAMIAKLMRDSSLVSWRAVAKDGMDLPPDQATLRPARQQMGMGETYDFELRPVEAANLRFVLTAANGTLLLSMPVRIE